MSNNITRVSFDILADIIFNILSRLPVKTLVRFKSVCKAWYALIENHSFVKAQKKKNSSLNLNSNFSNMLVTSKGPGSIEKCRLLHFSEPLQKSIDLELPYLSKTDSCVVVGICSGLVCVRLSCNSSELIICNPTTGKFRKIPSYNIPKEEFDNVFLGFGLHDNNYLLIRIVCTPSMNIRAELYTMCTDTWREIEEKLGECHWPSLSQSYEEFYVEAVVTNRMFHWKDGTCIVSFDILKGKLLIERASYENFDWDIRELEGEVALISCLGYMPFEILVKDEQTTWVIIHNIDIKVNPVYSAGDYVRPIRCTRNGELVLRIGFDNNFKLFLYDLTSQEIRNIDSEGFVRCAHLYTKSLTPIN